MKKTLANKEHTTQAMSHSSLNTTTDNAMETKNAANVSSSAEMQFSPVIDIAIETDDGYIQPPDIDEIEDQENSQPGNEYNCNSENRGRQSFI